MFHAGSLGVMLSWRSVFPDLFGNYLGQHLWKVATKGKGTSSSHGQISQALEVSKGILCLDAVESTRKTMLTPTSDPVLRCKDVVLFPVPWVCLCLWDKPEDW